MANLFLSIDGIDIEDAEEGAYTAYEQELGVSDRMISGLYVEELRGKIWVVEVSMDELDADTISRLQTAMKATRKHRLFFLPSTGGSDLQSGLFALTVLPQPTLTRWTDGQMPTWSGFTLRFEEVTPHD